MVAQDNNSAQQRLAAVATHVGFNDTTMASTTKQFPSFDEAPKVQSQPQGCLWGHFGEKDQIGSTSPPLLHLHSRIRKKIR